MSADNGIYILRTMAPPVKVPHGSTYAFENQHDKHHYRVAYCSAIDNLDYSDIYMPILFGKSKIFLDEKEAWDEARVLMNEVGYTEYGICLIDYGWNGKGKYYPNMTKETAEKAMDIYEGSIPV